MVDCKRFDINAMIRQIPRQSMNQTCDRIPLTACHFHAIEGLDLLQIQIAEGGGRSNIILEYDAALLVLRSRFIAGVFHL